MTELGLTWEREQLNSRQYRHVLHLKPIAYRHDDGYLRRIVSDWIDSGIANRPHIVTASRLMTSVGDDGMRRIHPTREAERYMEIGAPFVKVGGTWRKVSFSNTVRTKNMLAWTRPEANLAIIHAGHYVKLAMELKGGYVPEDGLVAFPVGLSGLTRSGAKILADGQTVALLRPPVAYDAANESDVRKINYQFTSLGGQPYLLMTLPSLAGMARPVVDPTLTLSEGEAGANTDTWLRSSSPNSNYGTNASLYIGDNLAAVDCGNCSLVKFDISSIPAGSTIYSVTASFYEDEAQAGNGGATTRTITMHRMLRNWVEAEATWNIYSTGNSWTTGGGRGDGTDRVGTASASVQSGVKAANDHVDFTGAGLVADVQGWLDEDYNNYGWLLDCDSNFSGVSEYSNSRYRSSDHATAAQRPVLTVIYTEGGGASIIPHAMHYARMRRAQ